jgi:hypothetical protein
MLGVFSEMRGAVLQVFTDHGEAWPGRAPSCLATAMVRKRSAAPSETLFAAAREASQPLAARMRPGRWMSSSVRSILLAPGKPLREAVERGVPAR